jgi:hypothetical protein
MKRRYNPSIIVKLKFQKRSALKFVSRTIPHSGGYNTPKLAFGFIPVIGAVLLLGAVLVSLAFAGMEKVDEAELARTNASVTGASVKDPLAGVEKGALNQETWQASEAFSRDTLSPSGKEEPVSVNLNVSGQTTFQFYKGWGRSDVTGGITSVTPHY